MARINEILSEVDEFLSKGIAEWEKINGLRAKVRKLQAEVADNANNYGYKVQACLPSNYQDAYIHVNGFMLCASAIELKYTADDEQVLPVSFPAECFDLKITPDDKEIEGLYSELRAAREIREFNDSLKTVFPKSSVALSAVEAIEISIEEKLIKPEYREFMDSILSDEQRAALNSQVGDNLAIKSRELGYTDKASGTIVVTHPNAIMRVETVKPNFASDAQNPQLDDPAPRPIAKMREDEPGDDDTSDLSEVSNPNHTELSDND